MRDRKVGIYAIRNLINDKMYIGQSVEIENRFKRHLFELNKGIHANKNLQKSWLKYGASNFKFMVLEEVKEHQLPFAEQDWINRYPREILYNHVFDIQFRRGESNPNYGNKQSLETRIKMTTRNSMTKLTVDQVIEIVELLKEDNLSHQQIADLYDISRSVVTRVSNGTRWTNITGGPVSPVIRVDGKRQLRDSHKSRIGEKLKGHQVSEEAKKKISEKRIGKKWSEETRQKIMLSKKIKRSKNANRG